jgi:NAD(P)-dependent dehydrogenase (short-subunit alcohol dehydrogenase family)
VTDALAVKKFAHEVSESLGSIDLWINNAGIIEPIGMARAVDAQSWGELIDINVKGVFNGSQAVLFEWARLGTTGTILNISSGAARGAYEGWSAYCASKAAVDQFTRVLALDEKARGHRIYALAPGVIETGMQEIIRAKTEADFPSVKRFRDMKAEGTLGDPEAPAAAILKLAFGPLQKFDDPCLDVRDLRG